MAVSKFPDMKNCLILPENRLSQKALICSHLLDGASLMRIYRWYSGQYKWRFCCADCYDCGRVVTLGEILKRFPEIENFLKTAFDCSVLFYRTEVGGRWHKDILE
ncbi:hypothetical protein [Intestinimonas butyriciproducens]|uniref:hypothetical protein n=3 Tax=Intestinimonas butyriciproducens TaxID=1297617 RepID=UPI0008217497|nr:hypothetical protein [Intestinimonas butyriciproducens]MCI6363588.1 hypothetical protein [Intestinimonas butyriciproducens]SCJ20151.1 Uncharacterised protein [uncultured Clostridium sp.]